jgi:steroid delta-isomerase-like uncharacterized protein
MATKEHDVINPVIDNKKSIEEQNKRLMRLSVEEIWNNGNYELADEILSPGFIIYSSTPGKEVHGANGTKDYYRSLRNAFPDLKFTIKDLIAEGDKVVTHLIAEGTHTGVFEGLPPTGKYFKVSAMNIDYIKDGRFTKCWTNIDELGLLQQLGVLPQGAPTKENASHKEWDKVAEGYDKYVTDKDEGLAKEALQRVGLKAGQNLLDVASGSGSLSIPAARMGANVIATDWSPQMINLFEKRIQKENLSNAKGQVMDAHNLEFDDEEFDVVGSKFGVMLVPDQPKALKEMVRVTKKGGKVLMIAYGDPGKIEFLNFFFTAIQSVAPHFKGFPEDAPPPEFQAANPVVLQQRMKDAGLKEVTVDTVTEKLFFGNGMELWNCIINSNPIAGQILSALNVNDEQVKKIQKRLEELIVERKGKDDTAIITCPVNIGIGIK